MRANAKNRSGEESKKKNVERKKRRADAERQ